MPDGNRLNERDTKLVQWLNEAHAKEAGLEADLTAHIALTESNNAPAPATSFPESGGRRELIFSVTADQGRGSCEAARVA